MKFKHKYSIEENVPAIYIRFIDKNYKRVSYVGQTKESLGGRPFRKTARGGSYRGHSKYKTVLIIRCPVSRLSVREAYFVCHHKPTTQKLKKYFKMAWHLLTKEKLMECLAYMHNPKDMSPNDWEFICKGIKAVENAKKKEEEESALIEMGILNYPRIGVEAFERLKKKNIELTELQKKGELLDPTSTLPQQRIWLENFRKKFGLKPRVSHIVRGKYI